MPARPMRPVSKVAIDDGIDLVGSRTRLVHTLRPDGDRAFSVRKEAIEIFKFCSRNTCCLCNITLSGNAQSFV